MAEPSPKLNAALRQVRAPWDAARTERSLQTLPARRKRGQRRMMVGVGAAASLLLACLLWLLPSQQLTLPDGSRIELLADDTQVKLQHHDAQLLTLRMGRGAARFSVVPGQARLFRVHTAHVTVEVLGTVFELTEQGTQTRVRVEHGRVAVAWGEQRVELRAGDEGLYPPLAVSPALARVKPANQAPASTAVESGTQDEPAAAQLDERPSAAVQHARTGTRRAPPTSTTGSWREHAERGDFKRAYPLLPAQDTVRGMSVSELLLAADAARLSGHPEAALPFLERVVQVFPEDARAPLAAFTLGGVLMQQLGRPREAEAAYGRAHAATVSPALAQDALARQVEAAHRAGDEPRARRLAQDYLRLYPEGRRVNAVRRFGGL